MFGDRLRKLRTARKMRQEDVATKLGIARTTYAMYEQGSREPDFETLQMLADLYEVSVDYLLGRSEIVSKQPTTEPPPNIAFIHGGNELTPDEIEHLEEELKRYRELKARFMKEKEKN